MRVKTRPDKKQTKKMSNKQLRELHALLIYISIYLLSTQSHRCLNKQIACSDLFVDIIVSFSFLSFCLVFFFFALSLSLRLFWQLKLCVTVAKQQTVNTRNTETRIEFSDFFPFLSSLLCA